jgi:hypothetical protein
MLRYQTINPVVNAMERLKRPNGYHYSGQYQRATHDLNLDKMLVWQETPRAEVDSQYNIEHLLSVGRKTKSKYAVISTKFVQLVSSNKNLSMDELVDSKWRQEIQDWTDEPEVSANTPRYNLYESNEGSAISLNGWSKLWCLPKHNGIYEVASGRRITNREEIIEGFWSVGFASWRGRPLRVAPPEWSGNRVELEELAQLADKHWGRRHQSEMAKKICQAYTSINRYAAWPGAW